MGGNNSSIRSNYSGRNIPPQTLKELRMQDEAIAQLEARLSELQEENQNLAIRAQSRGS